MIIDGQTGRVIEHEESLAEKKAEPTSNPALMKLATAIQQFAVAWQRDPMRAFLGVTFGLAGYLAGNEKLPMFHPPKKRRRVRRIRK